MMSDLSRIGVLDPTGRCPKCGCSLLTNDYDQQWCTNVGGNEVTYTGCTYGMKHDTDCGAHSGRVCNCGYEEAHRDKL